MQSISQIVLASNNPGKVREFGVLLAPLGLTVVAQSDLGVGEAREPHATFIENALAKARHACSLTGLPSLADDSGICVDALRGAPGVRSARFGGEPSSDERNNAALVSALKGITDRRAHYYCVIVLLRHAEDPEPLITDGHWDGFFFDQPAGENGFGYDPHFFLPESGCTAAQLSFEQKNTLSHRAQAIDRLIRRLHGFSLSRS